MPCQILFDIFSARNADECASAIANIGTCDGWAQLIREAVSHKCAPMLRERLREFALLERAPQELQERLIDITRTTAALNLKCIQQLGELAERLDDRAQVIVLKGGCLARTIYRDISLRPMADLDILTRPNHLPGVAEQLRSLGYSQDTRYREMWPSSHHEAPFVRTGAVPIELHWQFLNQGAPFPVDYEATWQRAKPANAAGSLLYPSPEDHFVYLCVHAAYVHEFNIGIYAFIDVAQMAQTSTLDWMGVIERAREWRTQRCVFVVLKMAEAIAGARIPADVMADIAPRDFSPRILESALSSVRFAEPPYSSPAVITAEFLRRLSRFEGWRSLGGTIRRRFLVRPELRLTWNSRTPGWASQIAPFLTGAIAIAQNESDRRRLRARLGGARITRWTEPM